MRILGCQLIWIGLSFLISVGLGCKQTKPVPESFAILSMEDFQAAISDTQLSTAQILAQFLPSVLELGKVDSTSLYYENLTYDDAVDQRRVLVGRLIDSQHIIATEIRPQDSLINFYVVTDGAWKQIGSEPTQLRVADINFEEMNGDSIKEMIVSTAPNMNGNTWNAVYAWRRAPWHADFAGEYSSHAQIDRTRGRLEERYAGSWYMDQWQTLYEWRGNMLVPVKKIVLAYVEPMTDNPAMNLEYYENATDSLGGLKLIFSKPHDPKNAEQQRLWDEFFDGKR